MKKWLRKIKLHKSRKGNILLAVGLLLSLAGAVLFALSESGTQVLKDQQAAARWEGKDMKYAQVSAFFSPTKDMQPVNMADIQTGILSKLSADGYLGEGRGADMLLRAYNGEASVSIRKDTSTLQVTAMGVGGDFFMLHPMELLAGNYFAEDDLNRDRIVLDENVAWNLFGSNDIAGMNIWINNNVYDVAGVVAAPEDEAESNAYGNYGRIYLPYESLKIHQEKLVICCYEAVIPDPISNYGYNTLLSACGMSQEEQSEEKKNNPLSFGDCEIIENTGRFSAWNLFSLLRNRKYRTMQTTSIVYPYWENLARMTEDKKMNALIWNTAVLAAGIIALLAGLAAYVLANSHRERDVEGFGRKT